MSSELPRPTFGVEVEFLIATRRVGRGFQDPDRHVEGLAPVLRITDIEYRRDGGRTFTRNRVKDVLDEYFGITPLQLIINPHYRGWDAEEDISIRPERGTPYEFIPMEISSPVLYSSPRGFDAISFAISLITRAQRIPLEHLRRIASLSYAIEPLLFTLHDPLRIVNAYCRPLRHHSLLAERESQDPRAQPYHNGYDDPFQIMVHHHIGRDRRHGEHPILTGGERFDFDGRVTDTSQIRPQVDAFLVTRQPGHFEPYVGPGDSRHTQDLPGSLSEQVDLQVSAAAPSTAPLAEPPRKRKIPRLRFPHYDRKRLRQLRAILEGANPDDVEDADDADEDVSNSRNPSRVSDNPSTGTSVFDAARRVYAQPASCYISNQMSSLVDFRLAINFDGYRCQNIGSDGRHTIEFRMGEGSLDAQWISTWAKICAGVFRFAIYSSPGDFISVLANCDRASKEDGSYDIVDLLDEIGLFAEAELVEKRLAAHKDQWNLQYAGQKKP